MEDSQCVEEKGEVFRLDSCSKKRLYLCRSVIFSFKTKSSKVLFIVLLSLYIFIGEETERVNVSIGINTNVRGNYILLCFRGSQKMPQLIWLVLGDGLIGCSVKGS